MKDIDDLMVGGRRVLVRLDLNVPMNAGTITDDGKIRASLPTLTTLIERGAAVIVCSHLGRPDGRPDQRYSLAPVARRLGELLGRPVSFATDTVGVVARSAAAGLQPGQVLMLENLRFNPGETSKDDAVRGAFASQLAALAELYVGDGFGTVHRRHASVCDVPARLPHAAGYLMKAEIAALSRLTSSVRRPYVVVLGGAKVADKLPVAGALARVADQVLIGGAMATTFLAAEGHSVGASLLQGDPDAARQCLVQAAATGVQVVLPADLLVAPDRFATGPVRVVSSDAIPPGQQALDIGPETASLFRITLAGAATVFWNGPMGAFENAEFAGGTRAVAEAMSACNGFTMVGGGDTAAAVRSLGFTDSNFSHVSTGGGASLEFLAGHTLPGLVALDAGSQQEAALSMGG